MNRKEMETLEEKNLNSYAVYSSSIERDKEVQKHPYRTVFQRDRDRILHSKAFRRLEYKTQVFTTQQGDHLRTRLTHSLEVSQISQTIARKLGLNCDLVEAISLGHDLGHTPFGHSGEDTLSELLKSDGANDFEHNVQSVKILELLEKKYHYDGLKLTKPVLEGILKHTSFPEKLPGYCKDLYIDKKFPVTLEGQVVKIADEIAQVSHDMDDYLRYNIIEFDKLYGHVIFDEIEKFYLQTYCYSLKKLIESFDDESRKKDTIIRCLVDYLVSMLIKDAESKLQEEDSIIPFKLKKRYIKYNEEKGNNRHKLVNDFHEYLEELLFSDYRVIQMDKRGEYIIRTLYNFYKEYPKEMPRETYKKYKNFEGNKVIVIADYISGMTDRYALNRYNEMIELEG